MTVGWTVQCLAAIAWMVSPRPVSLLDGVTAVEFVPGAFVANVIWSNSQTAGALLEAVPSKEIDASVTLTQMLLAAWRPTTVWVVVAVSGTVSAATSNWL